MRMGKRKRNVLSNDKDNSYNWIYFKYGLEKDDNSWKVEIILINLYSS